MKKKIVLPTISLFTARKEMQSQLLELQRYKTPIVKRLVYGVRHAFNSFKISISIQDMFASPNGNLLFRAQLSFVREDGEIPEQMLRQWLNAAMRNWSVKTLTADGHCLMMCRAAVSGLSNSITFPSELEKLTKFRSHGYHYTLAQNILASYDRLVQKDSLKNNVAAPTKLFEVLPEAHKALGANLSKEIQKVLDGFSKVISILKVADTGPYAEVIKVYEDAVAQYEAQLNARYMQMDWRGAIIRSKNALEFIEHSQKTTLSSMTNRYLRIVTDNKTKALELINLETDEELQKIGKPKSFKGKRRIELVLKKNMQLEALISQVKAQSIAETKAVIHEKIPPSMKKWIIGGDKLLGKIAKIDLALKIASISVADNQLEKTMELGLTAAIDAGGRWAGATMGAAIGTLVGGPLFGTIIGAIVGAAIGAFLSWAAEDEIKVAAKNLARLAEDIFEYAGQAQLRSLEYELELLEIQNRAIGNLFKKMGDGLSDLAEVVRDQFGAVMTVRVAVNEDVHEFSNSFDQQNSWGSFFQAFRLNYQGEIVFGDLIAALTGQTQKSAK